MIFSHLPQNTLYTDILCFLDALIYIYIYKLLTLSFNLRLCSCHPAFSPTVVLIFHGPSFSQTKDFMLGMLHCYFFYLQYDTLSSYWKDSLIPLACGAAVLSARTLQCLHVKQSRP